VARNDTRAAALGLNEMVGQWPLLGRLLKVGFRPAKGRKLPSGLSVGNGRSRPATVHDVRGSDRPIVPKAVDRPHLSRPFGKAPQIRSFAKYWACRKAADKPSPMGTQYADYLPRRPS